MANYTIAINWAGKDALSNSDPNKIISGTDFNTEFVAIRDAVNTKADLNGNSGVNFSANNITVSGSLTASSDSRIKKDVKELTNALEAVKKIRGVSYTRIDSEEKSIGVIAQEVEALFPELVVESDNNIKTVNYNGLIGILFAAVKELYELQGR